MYTEESWLIKPSLVVDCDKVPTETSALEHVPAAFDCYNSSNDYDDW